MSERRAQRFSIFALVVLCHVAAYLLLPSTINIGVVKRREPALEYVVLVPAAAQEPLRLNLRLPDRPVMSVPPSRPGQPSSHMVPERAPSAGGGNAITPGPDWNAELERAAKGAVPGAAPSPPRDFGFPHAVPAPPKPTQFGWDRSHTHRVELLPEGGMVISLSDNCILVLAPLPIALCGIGKQKPNGELFNHLHDAPAVDSGAAP